LNPHPPSPTPGAVEAQERFGARLRMQREARELSIADVVKVTKIPERSLLFLEAGAFRDLPAEVFVRGFLKSYSRCVGLDVEEILREYEELVLQSVPKAHAPPSLAHPAPPRDRRIATGENRAILAPGAPPPGVAAAPPSPAETADQAPAATPVEEKPPPEEPSIFEQLAQAGRSTSRASLAVAVIILVIVATVTLSLLLRRPGHVGDGVSLLPSSSSSS
jgi:hypothetical protein